MATEKPGESFYVAFPEQVMRVAFVEDGDGGRNFKRRKVDPVVVRSIEDSATPTKDDEFVVERSALYKDALAASIVSAEMKRKIEEEG